MGVQNLTKIMKECCNVAPATFESLRGQAIAVDATLYLYQSKIAAEYSSQASTFPSYLNMFLYRILKFRDYEIKPIFVFDGKNIPVQKNRVKEKRNEIREKAKCKIEVTTEDITLCQTLFDILRVNHLVADGEAERTCAHLSRTGVVDAVLSEDSDSLTFGAKKLLRKVSMSSDMFDEVYCQDELFNNLGLDKDSLIDLSIILGCDYIPKVKGLGPKSAIRVLKSGKRLQDLINNEDCIDYEAVRRLFDTSDLDDQVYSINLSDNDQVDVVSLRSFLVENGCEQQKIQNIMTRIS